MNIRLLFLAVIASINTSQAQIGIDMPSIIPPSPETATLFRSIGYINDHSRGVLDINIPIYEIQCGSLVVPITFNYDSSGRRANEITGPIGCNWSLNVGGSISRTIRGKCDLSYFSEYAASSLDADEITSSYRNEEYPISKRKENYELLKRVYDNENSMPIDTENDIFTFYLPNGESGSFLYRENLGFKLLNNKPVKIWMELGGQTIRITDLNGFEYTFISNELVTNSGYLFPLSREDISSWSISKIESPDKQHAIEFKYTTEVFPTNGISGSVAIDINGSYDLISVEPEYLPKFDCGYVINTSIALFYRKPRLKEIIFDKGILDFEISPSGLIKSITIKDTNHNTIKKAQLCQSSLESNILKLDKLTWIDKNDVSIEKYDFEYAPSVSAQRWNKDYWGYRNSAFYYNTFNHLDMFNSFEVKTSGPNGQGVATYSFGRPGVKEPSNHVKGGILKKIYYPTGGYTEFYYEENSFKSINDIIKKGNGLRIQKVISSDTKEGYISTEYKYDDGHIILDPLHMDKIRPKRNLLDVYTVYGQWGPYNRTDILGTQQRLTYTSDYDGDMAFISSTPVFYNKIVEYTNKDRVKESYKTEYTYSDKYASIAPRAYLYYTGEKIRLRSPFHKETYILQMPTVLISNDGWYIPYNDSYWKKNNLIAKKEYKNDGEGSYIPVKLTEYKYNESELETFKNILVMKAYDFPNDRYANRVYEYQTRYIIGCYGDVPVYPCFNYYISKGKSELEATVETIYSKDITISTQTDFKYNQQGQLLSKNVKTKTDNTKETYKYPTNGSILISKNMLATIIETTKEKNNKEIQRIKYNYSDSSIYPTSIQSSTCGANSFRTDITYNKYDSKGNLLQYTALDGISIVYLWGYNGQYPIAEIKNAAYEKVKSILTEVVINRLSTSVAPTEADLKKLNDLRSNVSLGNAMVTTYTYKPLVGMTSATDPSDLTTYYEYDDFGRLMRTYIKEKDSTGKEVEKNIQSYDYHYRNQ